MLEKERQPLFSAFLNWNKFVEITQDKKNQVNIVRLVGRLDANTFTSLEELFNEFVREEGILVLVNCEKLEYISSAGLRVLLAAAKQFKKGQGKIALTSLGANVKQVFEISGFTSIFPIYTSEEEALAGLEKK